MKIANSLILLLFSSGVTFADTLRPLRENTELFVDDVKISRMENLTRRNHASEKPATPVLSPDKPWEEGRTYIYGSVYRDPETGDFRMWYSGPGRTLYATSKDGLRWEKPELGIHEFGGSKANNILLPDGNGWVVMVDDFESDPARRYKALLAAPIRVGGFYGYYSADGIQWKPYSEERLIPFGSEMVQIMRDPATKKYFAYIRPYAPRHYPKSEKQKRLGAVTVSDDFLTWQPMKVVLTPDAVDDAWVKDKDARTEFYSMHGFPYGQSYLGVIPMFYITQIHEKKGELQSKYDGPMDGQLITSRDGLEWHRMKDRSPVIPSGETFDRSIMNVATAPLIVDDEIWLYYTAINTTHGGPVPPKKISIGLAKWRLDGFVSLDAGEKEGVVETVPISNRSGQLFINADAAKGQVKVEVLDAEGKVLPGYAADDCVPIRSDAVDQEIRWRDHGELPQGAPFRLRFLVQHASLYSYTITPAR